MNNREINRAKCDFFENTNKTNKLIDFQQDYTIKKERNIIEKMDINLYASDSKRIMREYY